MTKTISNGVERDCTPEEEAEIVARKAAALIPIVPSCIPMLNAHLVLISSGWFDAINAYIEALPDEVTATQSTSRIRSKARAYFNLAQTMERNHPLVIGIPAALGKTEAEIDALFVAAGKLNV
jgi:hypothetical protein